MNYRDSSRERDWRTEVQTFLEANAPAEYCVLRRPAVDSYGGGDATFRAWRETVARQGWLAPHWPLAYGGLGLSVMEQFIMKEEFALRRTPHPGARGVEMVGPTIILHGTDQQKAELLPGILTGEHIYCQGFSEPGAGSDLAALQLRAVRDGDDYILNGQKIWTSNATTCSWMFLLARTDLEAPKHRGISYFVTPMDVPGLAVRPIPDMAGGRELCETFFDNVRIPATRRIGEENRGWYVAMTTLDFERSGIAGAVELKLSTFDLISLARAGGAASQHANRLADLVIACEIACQMSYQVASLQDRGKVPDYQSSMVKLFSSELHRRLDTDAVNILGMRANLLCGSANYELSEGHRARAYSSSIPTTIAGGTSEIQRGIIASRGLGLPRG